jgi:hypothetical protein
MLAHILLIARTSDMLFCAIHITKPIERLKDYGPNNDIEKFHSPGLYFSPDNIID